MELKIELEPVTAAISTLNLPVKYNSCKTGLRENDVSSPKLPGRLQTPSFSR